MTTEELIEGEFDRLKEMVIQKNIDYGDSLQNGSQTFFKGSRTTGILCRLNDKMSRIEAVGVNENTIDTVDDIIGYLIHLRIAYNKDAKKEEA